MRYDPLEVVENPTNANQAWSHHAIKQKVPWLANRAFRCKGAITTVAQMVAAHHVPELWLLIFLPRFSWPFRISATVVSVREMAC